ncbi:MAG: O-antigen ligase domain-containing protein, partial [Sphingobacteriia bacterium]|nr:O-antigen ligase domain-containing protein [Sphingobacteriia bacterium]
YFIALIWAMITYLFSCQLALLFALGLGNTTTGFSFAFRVVQVLILLIVIIKWSHFGLSLREFPGFSILLRLFWLFYGLRILFHIYTTPEDVMMTTPSIYIGYGAISVLGLIFASRPFQNEKEKILSWNTVLYTCAVACLLIFIFQRDYLGESYRTVSSSLKNSDVYLFDGMGMGYIGAALVVFSLCGLLFKTVNVWLGCLFFSLGGILLVSGGTRGPVLATLFSIVFALFSIRWKEKKRIWIFIIVSLVLLNALIYIGSGTELLNRFFYLGEEIQAGSEDDIGSGRGKLYNQAISNFLASPLFGSGLEVGTGAKTAYCHNCILEAFISTGLFGGIIFILIIIRAFKDALWILRNSTGLGWIAGLFMMLFVGTLFSGSLYGATIMWPCIAAMRANVIKERAFSYVRLTT